MTWSSHLATWNDTVSCSITAVSCNSIHNRNDYCCAPVDENIVVNEFGWATAKETIRCVNLLWLQHVVKPTPTEGQLEMLMMSMHQRAKQRDKTHECKKRMANEDRGTKRNWIGCRTFSAVHGTSANERDSLDIFRCFFMVCARNESVFVSLHYFFCCALVLGCRSFFFLPVPYAVSPRSSGEHLKHSRKLVRRATKRCISRTNIFSKINNILLTHSVGTQPNAIFLERTEWKYHKAEYNDGEPKKKQHIEEYKIKKIHNLLVHIFRMVEFFFLLTRRLHERHHRERWTCNHSQLRAKETQWEKMRVKNRTREKEKWINCVHGSLGRSCSRFRSCLFFCSFHSLHSFQPTDLTNGKYNDRNVTGKRWRNIGNAYWTSAARNKLSYRINVTDSRHAHHRARRR